MHMLFCQEKSIECSFPVNLSSFSNSNASRKKLKSQDQKLDHKDSVRERDFKRGINIFLGHGLFHVLEISSQKHQKRMQFVDKTF